MASSPSDVSVDGDAVRRSRFTAWLVVWLCFATLSIVMSGRQIVSIMTDDWTRTLGWSKTFIGSGQSIVSFQELLPSLNDIFIKLVEGTPLARRFQTAV